MDKRFGLRLFWLTVGLVSLGLGIIGTVLPLLPTTPFLLLAAFAFARSSPKLANWLDSHPQFGPLIANWREHGAISRPAKIAAVVVILLTSAISITLTFDGWIIAVQLAVLGIVAVFILSRPDGAE